MRTVILSDNCYSSLAAITAPSILPMPSHLSDSCDIFFVVSTPQQWLSHLTNCCCICLTCHILYEHQICLMTQKNLPLKYLQCPLYTPECLLHTCIHIQVVMSLDSAQLCIFSDKTCLFTSCQLAVSLQNILNLKVT